MAVVPTYARRELGAELKRLREAAKLTQARAADACSWSLTKVVRLEGGTVTLTLHDLHALADLYKAGDDRRTRLVELLERTEEGRWWQAYGQLVPTLMDEFLALESQATHVHITNMGAFPGLLQCRPYAEAVFADAVRVPDPDDADALVELRMKRRRILDGGAQLHAVLGEALLIMPTGGVDVLKQQLEHVISLAERGNVTVQVVPLTVDRALTLGGVIIFDFEANATSVVYTEHAGGMNAYHQPHEVRRHKREAARLKALAWSPEKSLTQIRARLEDL